MVWPKSEALRAALHGALRASQTLRYAPMHVIHKCEENRQNEQDVHCYTSCVLAHTMQLMAIKRDGSGGDNPMEELVLADAHLPRGT